MANTGYKITPSVRQYFTSGPDSGSVVSASFDVDLTNAPFSASLDETDYFYRSYDPITCEPGFEDCVIPLLTSLTTGSRRGRFAVSYVTQSSFNDPINITASVSNKPDFSNAETFTSAIGSVIPISSSFISGTIYFRAFTSCSGPDPSPNSDPLSFTYDQIPPPLEAGSVNIVFTNTLSSPMEVLIRSTRGNANYTIEGKQSITYDYGTSPDQGAWSATGKSDDLNITIKGGARSTYGNYVQRRTTGVLKETYTSGGGFNNPLSISENSSTFVPDKGVIFKVQQLVLPINNTVTTTTFSLLQVPPPPPPPPPPAPPPPPPPPGPSPAPPYTPQPTTRFGSTSYPSQDAACADSNVNFREKTYFQFGNTLYLDRADALARTEPVFPYTTNYILTSLTEYLIVNKNGYIQNSGVCILPQITLATQQGAMDTQEEACARNKAAVSAGNTTYEYKDNRLVNRVSGYFAGTGLSGRYPIAIDGRGGQNIILSSGKIIGYETCGSELTDVSYGKYGWPNSSYPLGDPSNGNPRNIQRACENNTLEIYSLGPSGKVYYGFNYKDGQYKYVTLASGRWYKTTDGTFVQFGSVFEDQGGLIVDTADPC